VFKELLSKALAINDTLEEESNNDDSDEEDDEISLITRKMWKNKNSSSFNNSSRRSFHKKEKSSIICYECKKPGHFKSECPDLEKSKDKKNKLFKSKKKSLMSTWEALDDSSFDEDSEEEANLCLIVDASTSKAKPTLDGSSDNEDHQPDNTINSDGEEIILKSRQDLIKGYNKLLSTSARIYKAYREQNKHEDHKKIQQAHVVDFVLEIN